MGRKPSAAKNVEKVPTVMVMPENASFKMVERLPGNTKSSLEGVDSQLENSYPSVNRMRSHHKISPAREQVNPKSDPQEKYSTQQRKKSKYNTAILRRSQRIKSAVVHTSNRDAEPYFEDLSISESEKDEPITQMEKILPEPEENSNKRSLEEKLDYALQRLEALEKIIESLQSKVDENIGLDKTPSSALISHRSTHINSQKKLEALTDENQQLSGKLQNTLGKVEVFEKETRVLMEVLAKMKDVIVISILAKTNQAAVNASTQAISNGCADSAAKRKRHAQENGSD